MRKYSTKINLMAATGAYIEFKRRNLQAVLKTNINEQQKVTKGKQNLSSKARFIRRISAVSNAIEVIDNEMICFIVYCLNCIRYGRNPTYERGLRR